MKKNPILAIIAAIILCSCGGTNTTVIQMSEEESEKINASFAVVDKPLMFAYRVARKYSQSVPSTFTNATVAGDYGTVTFSGTSSESNDRIILILSSRYDKFGTWFGKISENQGSDTIFLDKNSKQLLECRSQLRNCEINYVTGTGSFIGTIRFNPTTISKQTDTTTQFTAPYQMTGVLQSSNYRWDLDESKTLTTTFKK